MELEQLENRVIYCNTRRFAGDDAVKTKLTLDMSGVTKDDLIEYAIDSLVIKWQTSIRKKKNASVPSEATYKVPKPGTRAAAEMSDEEMLMALAKKFGSVEKVEEELRRRMGRAPLEV